jgi:prepilin-type N-terminal cleavage/methylation domain-containing protein
VSVRRCEASQSSPGITHYLSAHPIRRESSRGFSLIEATTVLAVVGVIAGIALGGIEILRKSSLFSGSTGDLVTSLRKTRAEAFGRGIYTAFIIDTVGGRWWGIEAPSGLSLATFNPSSPGTVIVSGSLPTGTVFGPSTGYGVALPAPFTGIPTLPSQSPNFNYCSFCNTGGPNLGFGEILFEPAGAAQFSGGPAGVGQQFTIQGTFQTSGATGGGNRTMAVAITAFSGAVEKFEQ